MLTVSGRMGMMKACAKLYTASITAACNMEKNMKTIDEIKSILLDHKDELRERYGVLLLGAFGSYVRGSQNEKSDIDILIDIERPIGLAFFQLWDELERLFGGKVDLVRKKLLRHEIKDAILKEALMI